MLSRTERPANRDFQTAMNVSRLRQQLERQPADHCARQASRYWAERDQRRNAQQPTHVEVDLDAWRAIRVVAARRARSVGQEGGGRRAKLFARLVVGKSTWHEFRALAVVRDITVGFYVGRLVEACIDVFGGEGGTTSR